ncbi:MAG TPA: thioredoxin domain-containing protein [Conexibacter sp.]|nr:thioredoxin domain-containing protein [Conexibacter sp.]
MADSTETRKERRASARAERDRAAEAARARQRQRLWVIGGALAIAVVVVVAIAIASGGGSSTPKKRAGEVIPGQIESNALFAGIPQNGITLGDPRAPVTMVEFADLQCPYCREYTQQSLSTLVTTYVRTGKVKMIFRNVAFIGNDSLTAAKMAAAVGLQNKLWTFIDLFYTNQQEENSGYVTDAFLQRIASGVKGLNVARAMSDRNGPKLQRQLDEAQAQWTSNGFSGTPSFLVGPTGGTLSAVNVRSLGPADFSAAIDKALASAPRAAS